MIIRKIAIAAAILLCAVILVSDIGKVQADTESGGKILVVYFSGTGNTRRAAGYIASALSADIFEVTPKVPYTAEDLDYRNKNSRVMRERYNESLQKIELSNTSVEGWESYDTVFIGYPIWGGNAAWPINGFIEANDFTGKRVIPFCTHGGSGLGRSGEHLRDLAGSGTWLEGRGFYSSVTEEEVRAWLAELKL